MRNITVSVDDETHRTKAAELDTSVSALVRDYLRRLARGQAVGIGSDRHVAETERERRGRLLAEAVEDITKNGGGLHMADNLPRDSLHDRRALR